MTDAPTPSGAMQDTATHEEMVEIAAEGISSRIDIDTGPQEWAEGAAAALIAAADGEIATISDLTREREAAREALRPFAAEADEWADIVPDDYHPMQPEMGHKGRCLPGSEAKFNLGDLRRARAALTTLTGEPAEAREKEAGRGR